MNEQKFGYIVIFLWTKLPCVSNKKFCVCCECSFVLFFIFVCASHVCVFEHL